MLSFMNYTHAPLTNWGLKLVDVQDGWTMLDVGCGGGFTIRRLLKAASKRGQSQTRLSFAEREQARPKVKGAQVYGIDISEESVAKAKKVNAKLLDEAGFTQTEIHRKKPTYATIIGMKA